ncbi:hypothetical protein BCR33DRAFT_718833 [Rhizoclosmatium globosum]|uniref:BZIP domain-containing protein n=1 Tax=Rhizoclosmatium globosum TaxID=329046 RepID=A0A1Y2C493_9FUNG|nr:hypothetical protein BCR33DRAFT_718833 [Rhizoclosmatium globosum]|eukprot:ORY41707.1 hypothetical protein BCR33DRAFT_718833 [Rhizoclosmatium globosum]
MAPSSVSTVSNTYEDASSDHSDEEYSVDSVQTECLQPNDAKTPKNDKRIARNRRAQRAFRERKERYVHDLEEKLREQTALIERLTTRNLGFGVPAFSSAQMHNTYICVNNSIFESIWCLFYGRPCLHQLQHSATLRSASGSTSSLENSPALTPTNDQLSYSTLSLHAKEALDCSTNFIDIAFQSYFNSLLDSASK